MQVIFFFVHICTPRTKCYCRIKKGKEGGERVWSKMEKLWVFGERDGKGGREGMGGYIRGGKVTLKKQDDYFWATKNRNFEQNFEKIIQKKIRNR